MKVLSIGNSFSTDAHRYLQDMAMADNEALLLANLYIGGCSLETHHMNYLNENKYYTYEVYYPFINEKISPSGIALQAAVEDEEWDVITLQQCSHFSGLRETYSPHLAELAAYCRLMHPNARIMFHQTWAYEKGCPKPEFAKYYNSDQIQMYNQLTQCCVEACEEAEIDIIIPSGRAWQTARETSIGDRLTRDGFHGNELGCFLASACFYEKIFERDITQNGFMLPDFDEDTTKLLKMCAHITCQDSLRK